jgi:hypothetical protein
MAISLRKALNRHHFERTIDWRIDFSHLFNQINILTSIEPRTTAPDATGVGIQSNNVEGKGGLFDLYPDGYVFASDCNLDTSLIQVVPSQVPGYYDSKLVYPTFSMSLYTDKDMRLEKALALWGASAYRPDGLMPVNIGKTIYENHGSVGTRVEQMIRAHGINPVQEVIIDRIDPVQPSVALRSLIYDIPFTRFEQNRNVVGDRNPSLASAVAEQTGFTPLTSLAIQAKYHFLVYLTTEPKYQGNNSSNDLRIVRLNFSTVGFSRDVLAEYRKENMTMGFDIRADWGLNNSQVKMDELEIKAQCQKKRISDMVNAHLGISDTPPKAPMPF